VRILGWDGCGAANDNANRGLAHNAPRQQQPVKANCRTAAEAGRTTAERRPAREPFDKPFLSV